MAGGGLVKAYLFLYNAAQTLGWAYALGLVAQGMREGGPTRAYAYAGETVCLLQAAAFLETVHAALGLVRSGVPASLLHWSGRSHALLAVVARFPELQNTDAAGLMLLAWALIEVIRYPQYALSLLDMAPGFLTWLRYTAFIPLYPLGAATEWFSLYLVLPRARRGLYGLSLPNALNFSFDYAVFVQVVLAVYLPLFSMLYSHMFRQRAKKLGGGGGKEGKKD